jgi:hypothetical protein
MPASSPQRKQQGYLLVDHRFSPGLPEDVALASGYDPKLAGEGKLFEADTLTCAHCKTAVIKNPLRTRERAHCHKCNFHYVCDICAAAMLASDYTHLPFEGQVEAHVNAMALGSPLELLKPEGTNEGQDLIIP